MEKSRLAEKPSLTIVRRFAVAPEKVWQAWTDPQALKQWFGPDAGKVTLAEADVRVGGRFRIAFHTMDGELHDVSGEYREVEPHRRLAFTWAWRSTPERESLVTLTFRPVDGGTEFTVVHGRFFDEQARNDHERGWIGAIAKLERHLGG